MKRAVRGQSMPAPEAAMTVNLEAEIPLIARPEVRNQIQSVCRVSGPGTNAAAAWPSPERWTTSVDLHSDG